MQPLARRSFLAAGGALLGVAAVQRPSVAQALDSLDAPSIPIATGSGVGTLPDPAGPFFDITDFGAVSDGPALANQAAINDAIAAAVQAGGGTVVIPAGTYKTYTIRLASNVGLHLASPDTVLRAAVPGEDGGYYDAAEANPFIGLQDQGHSHFRNSLIVDTFVAFSAKAKPGTPQFVFVTHTKKRDSWLELVPNQPYRATSVSEVVTPPGAVVERVTLTRPAPGTPPDDLYSHPTAPTTTFPYAYNVPNSDFTMPPTVFPDLSGALR